jgi:hypothetical protein
VIDDERDARVGPNVLDPGQLVGGDGLVLLVDGRDDGLLTQRETDRNDVWLPRAVDGRQPAHWRVGEILAGSITQHGTLEGVPASE